MKITKVDDYVDAVAEKFPELPKEDIKRILSYGFKMILLYMIAGNDIQVLSKKIYFFIGNVVSDPLKHFKLYCHKLAKRIAYMYRRTRLEWDGHYYFALNHTLYLEYLKQSKKKIKVFHNIMIYKILEECRIAEYRKPYIFRVSEDLTDWRRKFYRELKTDNVELIILRDPLCMKDILVSLNKIKYIQ